MKKNQEFSTLYKKGKKWHCEGVIIFHLKSEENKMAVVASKKIGKAVVRNKSKRLLREVFRKFEHVLENGVYVLVAKDSIVNLSFLDLKKNVKWGFRRLKCLK